MVRIEMYPLDMERKKIHSMISVFRFRRENVCCSVERADAEKRR